MAALSFSVDSALLSELGEKLVESVHIALLELVKNAYDADATRVRVRIVPTLPGALEVHVEDNGSGMTYEEVQGYWMRIATTHKAHENVSPRYGRPRTGSKGIGRFSCRRLGDHLALTTVGQLARNRYEKTQVAFCWRDFVAGSELATIKCQGSRTELSEAESGTNLVISGVRADEWTRRGFDYLKRQLAVLVANRGTHRAGYEEDPGFNISLEALDFEGGIIDVRDGLLAAGWGTLSATVDSQGRAVCHLSALGVGERQITSRVAFPSLAGASLRIGVLVDNRAEMRSTADLSKGTLREIVSTWGGVYVRYSGVRVYPYGDPGNDWLNIDRDRAIRKTACSGDDLVAVARRLRGVDPSRVLLSLLSARNYVGDVEIDSRAKGFLMKANREGFVASPAVEELRAFARYAIEWATVYRDYYIRLQAAEQTEEARRRLEGVVEAPVEHAKIIETAVDYVRKEVRTLTAKLPTRKRQEVQKAFATAVDAVVRVHATQSEELRHLRLIASTSTLLLIFSHEVKSLIGGLDSVVASLGNIEKAVPSGEAAKCHEVASVLHATKHRFIQLLAMTALVGVESQSTDATRLALAARLEKAKACFRLVTDAYDIDIDTSKVPTGLKVGPMLEAELYAILLNVLSNAIKSVIAAGGPKRIAFEAERIQGRTSLHARDTGIGLAESLFEEVFVPFIADPEGKLYSALESRLNPEDEYIVGTGSGLGLSIARDIARSRKGEVRFVPPKGEWRADLEIELP